MDPLLHSRHFRRVMTVLIVAAVIAASGIRLSPFSESEQGISQALSTFLLQQDTYLMHDGDTLNRTVIVPEGTYLVVKSDQLNINANVKVSGSGGFVVENGAVLVLENVNFSSTDEDRSTPVFYVYGDMVMNDGTIGNFSCLSAGSDSDYGKGGAAAICVVDGTFTMNGGAIFNNSNITTKEAAFGGALRAEGENAAVIINDGKISGNEVLSSAVVTDSSTVGANALGGAIAVTEGASLTIRGGEISDNTAGSHEANADGADNSICSGNGGGIAVYSSSSDAISSIYLDGGSILNNKAYRTGGDKGTAWDSDQTYGGGIFSNSYTRAVLNSGRIAGNVSDDKGGGLFLDCDRSYGGASFQNTLVTGNEAEVVGGGLWFCPDGEADMFSEAKSDGIAIFGNTTARRGTDGAGDDIYVSPRSGDTGVFLTESMPGGGSNVWYQDGGAGSSRTTDSSTRYTSSETVASAVLLQASAVTNKPSEQAIDSAAKSATVVITGNSATYGGGVGSNHYLIFGTPTEEEEEEHDVPSVTPEPEKISINVNKVWVGDAGTEATVHLLANGEEAASAVLNADNDWTYTFTGIDKTDSDGNEITYTLTEDPISGYASEVSGDASSGFTVTNTKKISIKVTKTWIGDAGTEATVHLLANGEEAASATLTEDTGWTYTFTNLDQADSSGNEIAYTLTEDAIDGYETGITGDAAGGFTVTNTRKIDIPVTVNWIRIEGTEATVRLLANGTEVDNATLTASTGWEYTFVDLDQVDSEGNKIAYSLTEDAVSGYATDVSGDASSGFTVTNIETVNVHVEKSWSQGLEESVTVRLIINGESTETTLTLTEYTDTDDNPSTNGWNGDFENLPKYDNDGNKITYYVSEDTDVGNMIFYKYEVVTMSDYYFIVVNSYRTSG
ncbi:MAG: Cna B-type domain-containing protein [Eubacterium sp.]|jgi:predicted metal-binding protein